MESKFRVGADGVSVDATGLKYDFSDFDGYAVEAALQLNEKQGPGETVVISLGPDSVQETLRKAMSMGAERAVQLKADAVPADGFAIATALAAELKGGSVRSYFVRPHGDGHVGRNRGRHDRGVARTAMRDEPVEARYRGGEGHRAARTRRRGGDCEFSLPAVVTIDEGVARPRYPALKGIMAAKKKPLEVKPAQLGAAHLTVTKMELPPERKAGRIIGEGPAAMPELSSCPEEAKVTLMANVFAFAEQRSGALRRVALESVTAARTLADASGGGEVHAMLIGAPGVQSLAAELGKYGAMW